MEDTPAGQIMNLDEIDYKAKKCQEHHKYLIKIDLRNSRLVCVQCETDNSDQIVYLEIHCYDIAKKWMNLAKEYYQFDEDVKSLKDQFKKGLYSKIYAELSKDEEQKQPQQEIYIDSDVFPELMSQVISAYRELDGQKLLDMNGSLEEQKNLLAARKAAVDTEMSMDQLVKLSISKTNMKEAIEKIMRSEQNKDDLFKFMFEREQALYTYIQELKQDLSEKLDQNQAFQVMVDDLKSEQKDEMEAMKQQQKDEIETLMTQMNNQRSEDRAQIALILEELERQKTEIAALKEVRQAMQLVNKLYKASYIGCYQQGQTNKSTTYDHYNFPMTFEPHQNANDEQGFYKNNPRQGIIYLPGGGGTISVIVDVHQVHKIDKFLVFQMFYDGKVTHVQIYKHPNGQAQHPAVNDGQWAEVTNGFAEIGAGQLDGNTLKQPTLIALQNSIHTRYLKFIFKNDGRHGHAGWIEVGGIKAF